MGKAEFGQKLVCCKVQKTLKAQAKIIESESILSWNRPTGIIESTSWSCPGHPNNPTLCLGALLPSHEEMKSLGGVKQQILGVPLSTQQMTKL